MPSITNSYPLADGRCPLAVDDAGDLQPGDLAEVSSARGCSRVTIVAVEPGSMSPTMLCRAMVVRDCAPERLAIGLHGRVEGEIRRMAEISGSKDDRTATRGAQSIRPS